MQVARGSKANLRTFKPSVILLADRGFQAWDAPSLQALKAVAEDLGGDRWDTFGPVLCRPECSILLFEAPFDRPPASQVALLQALAAAPGFDDVVLSAPHDRSLTTDLLLQPSTIILRMFPRRGPGEGVAQLEVWLNEAFDLISSEFGEPTHIAFNDAREVKVADRTFAAAVVREIAPATGMHCSALWAPRHGNAVVAGSAARASLKVAVVGSCVEECLEPTASQLVEIAHRLVSLAEPLYARVSIEPGSRGALSYYSTRQSPSSYATPGRAPQRLLGPPVTERHLQKHVPDAYWWQLIDTTLLKELGPGFGSIRPITDRLASLTFGTPTDWYPPKHPGGEHLDGPPEGVLADAREMLRSLLWYE